MYQFNHLYLQVSCLFFVVDAVIITNPAIEFCPDAWIDGVNGYGHMAEFEPRQVIRRLKEAHAKCPNMSYCILLGDYFDINPNELRQIAGRHTLKVFDINRARIDNLPIKAVNVALDIARIPDPRTRKQVAEAVRVLLKKYFNEKEQA